MTGAEEFEPKGALTFTLLFAAALLILWFAMYALLQSWLWFIGILIFPYLTAIAGVVGATPMGTAPLKNQCLHEKKRF